MKLSFKSQPCIKNNCQNKNVEGSNFCAEHQNEFEGEPAILDFIPKIPKNKSFKSGATRSNDTPERLDLVPHSADLAIGRRLELGARTHGEQNWRLAVVTNDLAWRKECVKRLKNHLGRYWERGGLEDLDAVITNAAFLCEFEVYHPWEGTILPNADKNS